MCLAKLLSGGIWDAREPPRWGYPNATSGQLDHLPASVRWSSLAGPSHPRWLWSRRGLNGPQVWSTVHRHDRRGWTGKRCRPMVFDQRCEFWPEFRRRAGAGSPARASVADPGAIRSGGTSAWVGLVPKQNSSGAKTTLAASVSKANVLHSLLTVGALAAIRYARSKAPGIGLGLRACSATDQGRCHRASQQARQDGLGSDGQGRAPPRAGGARGFKRDRAEPLRRVVTVGRAKLTRYDTRSRNGRLR